MHVESASRRADTGRSATSRLRPAGRNTNRAVLWATRLSCAALVGAGAWMLLSLLRPLPTASAPPPLSPPTIPTPQTASMDLAAREALLSRLHNQGNIFAPDRQPWPLKDSATASSPGEIATAHPVASASAPSAKPAPKSTAPPRYEDIEIVEKPPVGIEKDLKDLRLRGVYRTEAGAVALIGTIRQKNAFQTFPRRIGDSFDDGNWTVVAIDEVGMRVILSRIGVNVELKMFGPLEGSAAVVKAKPAVIPGRMPNPSVVVYTKTPEQLRAELMEAGFLQEEIAELVRLMEEAEPDAPAAVAQSKSAPARGIPLDSTPPIQPELAELLRMMSSGVGPSSPAIAPRRPKSPAPEASPPPP